jgi:aminomethyltransferase
MPLSYPLGTLEEHRECREGAVAFDVSHLGTVRVSGAGAKDAIQATFTNDLGKVHPGRAQYTHLLDESGSVLDDIIIWWVAEDVLDVMPNASNTDGVVRALAVAAEGAVVEDTTHTRAVIAIQGPRARVCMESVAPDAAAVPRFGVSEFTFDGVACLAAGTGYTGEDGLECAVPVETAGAFWQALLTAGIVPAGLGARDTLRLEAGLPLHGHELGKGLTPLNAGLSWVVAWDKGDFPGREALVRQREAGVSPILHGISAQGRRPIREGTEVRHDGRAIGTVTSGNFSPTLGCGIAMAYLNEQLDPGTLVSLVAVGSGRSRESEAEIVKMPFVPKH